ncbi:MAG: hypothetical protein OEN21_08360 [Myxococcales bacterium]|nr:hypothetical protein [Myxococcales bacterium]
MTRYNIFRTLVSSSIILAAVGCGDSGVDERSVFEEPAAIGPSESGGGASLEEELELACNSACDAMQECPGMAVTENCVESCVAAYGVGAEAGDECTLVGIDLLNCISALSCSTPPFDDDCADAVREVRTTCGTGVLRVREDSDSDRELVAELADRSSSDLDGSADEPDPADGSEDEEPGVIDLADPIVIAEVPDLVVIVDFPWGGVSEDD